MSTNKEIRKKHRQQECGRLGYIFEAMARGEDPRKAQDKLNRREIGGIDAEKFTMKVMSELPEVISVVKANEEDDRFRKIDLLAKIKIENRQCDVKVQVKSSKGGEMEFRDRLSANYSVGGDDLDRRMIDRNMMVIVVGNVNLSEENRRERVVSQFNEWVKRKSLLLGTT